MQQVRLDEATTQLADLIDAAMRGEVVFITKNGEQSVRLVPVSQGRFSRRAGSAQGLIAMARDFDEPLDDFDI